MKNNVLIEKSLLFAARIVKLNKFYRKMQIALKETAETEYWLRLLALSDCLTEKEGASLVNDCLDLKRLLIATLNTAKTEKGSAPQKEQVDFSNGNE